jgi:hypothetical protein
LVRYLKCAIVFALFKKGDRSNCDNYRGISVLSPFAKIFERILAANITSHFIENNLFSEAQHGFRSKPRLWNWFFNRFLKDWNNRLKPNKLFSLFLSILRKLNDPWSILLILNSFLLSYFIMASIISPYANFETILKIGHKLLVSIKQPLKECLYTRAFLRGLSWVLYYLIFL